MKRSLVLSVQSFDVLAPAARAAEKAGLDRVWVTETPGRDVITRAVHVARETETIAVGTGIAYAFTRHPIAMASAAIEAGADRAPDHLLNRRRTSTHPQIPRNRV